MTSAVHKEAFESIKADLRALYLGLAESVAFRESRGMWADGADRRAHEDERDLVLAAYRLLGGNVRDLRDERDELERKLGR